MACDFFLLKDELMTQFVKQILEIFINSFSDKDVAALFIELRILFRNDWNFVTYKTKNHSKYWKFNDILKVIGKLIVFSSNLWAASKFSWQNYSKDHESNVLDQKPSNFIVHILYTYMYELTFLLLERLLRT